MSRIRRNRAYRIEVKEKLPTRIIIRDILLTLVAWGLAVYVCWDFLALVASGLLHEFDPDPQNDLNWHDLADQLRISFLFSGTVLVFIFGWTLSNLRLLRRSREMEGTRTEPLELAAEVEAYGCTEDEVTTWRNQEILTVSIDDDGQILEVEYDAGSPGG